MERKLVLSTSRLRMNESLKPKEVDNGYYKVTLGALNVFNSVGIYYTSVGVEELLSGSSTLMRQLNNGFLRAELNHPPLEEGMSQEAWKRRLMRIDNSNTCANIRKIEMVPTNIKAPRTGDNVILINGEVKAIGPKADALRDFLKDEDSNVAFSVRSFALNMKDPRGFVTRKITTIVTWDYVTEPGIEDANQWATLRKGMAPSIEDRDILSIDLNNNLDVRDKISMLSDGIVPGIENYDSISSAINEVKRVCSMNDPNCAPYIAW